MSTIDLQMSTITTHEELIPMTFNDGVNRIKKHSMLSYNPLYGDAYDKADDAIINPPKHLSVTEDVSLFLDTMNLNFKHREYKNFADLCIEHFNLPKLIDKCVFYVDSQNVSLVNSLKTWSSENIVCHKAGKADVEIALDICDCESDYIIVGSNSPSLVSIYRRHDVYVVGYNIPKEVRKTAFKYWELNT